MNTEEIKPIDIQNSKGPFNISQATIRRLFFLLKWLNAIYHMPSSLGVK